MSSGSSSPIQFDDPTCKGIEDKGTGDKGVVVPILMNFPPDKETIITRAIALASELADRCVRQLIFSPYGPSPRLVLLLRDTFGLEPISWERSAEEAWEVVGSIRERFETIQLRMKCTTFFYCGVAPSNLVDAVAWVTKGEPDTVHVLDAYFGLPDDRKMAVALIHEFVHVYNNLSPTGVSVGPGEDEAHPGMHVGSAYYGERERYAQQSLSIETRAALANPYCYQYFAEWL